MAVLCAVHCRFFYELDNKRLGYDTLKPLVGVVLGPLADVHRLGLSSHTMLPAPLALLARLLRDKLADKAALIGAGGEGEGGRALGGGAVQQT